MKLDGLNGLLVLVKVAEKGSFALAARELRITPSAVSQAVKGLETRLGVTLLSRTTRSVHLTDIGQRFLEKLTPGLSEVQGAIDLVGTLADRPVGTLRLNFPRLAYSVLEPALAAYAARYPEVSLEVDFDEQLVDIVAGGYDAGVRLSETVARDMIGIRLQAPFSFLVVGAPSYLKKNGTPKKIEELLQHRCVLYRYPHGGVYDRWEFERRGKEVSVQVKGALTMNDPMLLTKAARAGLGLMYGLGSAVAADIRAGRLQPVLEEYAPRTEGFFLYYPNRAQALPKLRAFVDICREMFTRKSVK